MVGVAGNLNLMQKERLKKKNIGHLKENEEHSLLEALTYMVREELTGHKIQGSEDTISSWKKWIEERSSKTIENLSKSIMDQREYAKIMRKLIGELEFGDELGEDPDDEEDDGLDSDAEFTGSDEDQDIDQSDVQETDFSDTEMDEDEDSVQSDMTEIGDESDIEDDTLTQAARNRSDDNIKRRALPYKIFTSKFDE